MQMQYQILSPLAKAPARATEGSAGLDLTAALPTPSSIPSGARALIPTGIAVALEPGTVGLVFARSGLATKHGIALSNGVGVIDSDYRGEVRVGLVNLSEEAYVIEPGERIAQLVVVPICMPEPVLVEKLPETGRGAGGFGSTGRMGDGR
ncbi:MAG TPA: dUTP diphosphatase [Terriglobales bacterium]|nr:dUTP diphosphatase [Terriglobales bacterium]